MGICYVFGAMGCSPLPEIKSGDFVIAADSGYLNLGTVKPDAVVGDFDSLGFVPEGTRVVRHPARKDDTDMMLSVKLGLAEGFRKFIIYGGLGGRLDHTIANIHVLKYLLEHGARGCLAGESENLILVENGEAAFCADASGAVSVFSYGQTARGVTLEGLSYGLKDAVLTYGCPLGVSNAFTGAASRMSVLDGCLIVIWHGEPGWTDYVDRG